MANVNEILGQELKRLAAQQKMLREKHEHFRKELMTIEENLVRTDACYKHTASLIQVMAKADGAEDKPVVAPAPEENNVAQ